MSWLFPKSKQPAPEVIHLAWSYDPQLLISVSDNLPLTITVINHSQQPTADNACIFIAKTEHFAECMGKVNSLPSLQSIDCNIVLLANPRANVYTLREYMDVQLIEFASRKCLAKMTIRFPFWLFTSRLHRRGEIPPDFKLNISAFGMRGTGKSALINHIYTMMRNLQNCGASEISQILTVAPVATTNDHTTLEFKKYIFPNSFTEWFDIFGTTTNNFTDILKDYLDGKLPEGWDESMSTTANRHQLITNDRHYFLLPHAIIYVVSYASLHKADELALIRSQLGAMAKCQLQPIVVVSLSDLLDKSMRDNPCAPSAQIKSMSNEIACRLGMNERDVYLSVSYTSEHERVFELDRNVYKIIDHALNNAESKFLDVVSRLRAERHAVTRADAQAAQIKSLLETDK